MSCDSIDIAYVILKLTFFFPLIVKKPQGVTPFSHAECFCKTFGKIGNAQTMFLVTLKGNGLV